MPISVKEITLPILDLEVPGDQIVEGGSEFYGETGVAGHPVPIDQPSITLPGSVDYSQHYSASKRSLDIIGSLVGLCVLGPVILAAMAAVFLKDGKSVIFRQTRVGRDGKEFTLLKIRTMCVDAEERLTEVQEQNRHDDHRTFKMDNDPRVIPIIGGFLRRFSIDEFPQIINVLQGDMSLVGPRPAIVSEVEQYSSSDRFRLIAKPGLTCYWQVGGRGTLGFQEQLKLDLKYIDDCSTLTDIKLIVLTIPALFHGHGAC